MGNTIMMKILYGGLLSISLLLFNAATANENPHDNISIEFSTNQVHGLYNFVQALAGTVGATSPTLNEIFSDSEFNNAQSKQILSAYKNINISYDYDFNQELAGRHNSRQIWQLFIMASTQAKDLDDFQQRTFGLITTNDHQIMISTLRYFEPIYQKLIWEPSQAWLDDEIKTLGTRASTIDINQHFNQAKSFYRTQWNSHIPFKVFIVPIPRNNGISTATPQGNILSFTTMPHQNTEAQLGIIFHELAHILFENQPIATQKDIEKMFLESSSPYKVLAYQILDEALATALGNGWFYKLHSGELDTNDWYFSPYINTQAKSTYSLVERYIKNNKTLDKAFVDDFIKQYGTNFPNSYLNVDTIMANTIILAEQGKESDNRIFQAYFNNLQFLRSINIVTPLDNLTEIGKLQRSINTRLILITEQKEQNIENLKKYFPWLTSKKRPTEGNYIMAYLAPDGVMEILFAIDDMALFETAIQTLSKKKTLSDGVNVIKLP